MQLWVTDCGSWNTQWMENIICQHKYGFGIHDVDKGMVYYHVTGGHTSTVKVRNILTILKEGIWQYTNCTRTVILSKTVAISNILQDMAKQVCSHI